MPTASLFGRTLATAGITTEQLERAIALCDQLDKLSGPSTARKLLQATFGCSSRKELTEEKAEQYLVLVRAEIDEAERAARVAKKAKGPYRIRRADFRGGHRYDVFGPDGTEIAHALPGITTALNVLDKPALLPWMANLTGDAFKAEIRRVLIDEAMPNVAAVREELLPLLNVDGYKLGNERKKAAGERGTDGHTVSEILSQRFVRGESIDDDALRLILIAQPKLAAPDVYLCALAFREWILRTRPKVLATESMTACLHCACAATLDLHCEIDSPMYGGEWVLDIKTSGGVYESYALQTAFQAHALMQMRRGLHERHCAVYRRLRIGALWINAKADQGCEIVEFDNTTALLEAAQKVIDVYRWKRASSWRRKPASFPRSEEEVAESVRMVKESRANVA